MIRHLKTLKMFNCTRGKMQETVVMGEGVMDVSAVISVFRDEKSEIVRGMAREENIASDWNRFKVTIFQH